jgi:hypothetical protein
MSQVRRGATLSLAVAIMVSDAIRRFFGDLRPADWAIIFIELLFVGVVVAQWIFDSRHKRHLRDRRRDVYALVAQGQELLKTTPLPSFLAGEMAEQAGVEWILAVDKWRTETSQTLASLSEKAASSFMLISSFSGKDARVYTPTVGSFPVKRTTKGGLSNVAFSFR